MKHVVITGGTRGIGFGLAREFLIAGCKVTIIGQSTESVNQALKSLSTDFLNKIQGYAVVVDKRDQLETLWEMAVTRVW